MDLNRVVDTDTDTDTDAGTGTKVRPDTDARPDTSYDDGDRERFAHYVQKEKITESAVTGSPVIALCGKVWVPNRDPKRYPVCPECKDIYAEMTK
ncbi:DUF3039 domain-containing protein [Halostreptopolyspora alba]|uniref:DUF3039 domain-containing protein n=1 Tax=Halostreptopolyspora alba TaxID=2487137 RepID=A0A3N0E9X1_9ACTN|nr:DUF3039 domain-containing protein [Nocardiopsaceae bacterium YIM 96095]